MRYQNLRALLTKRFSIPKERAIRRAMRSFTIAEKTVFYFFAFIFILSGIALVWQVSSAFLVEVPTKGGTLTEGVVGNPRFINPVLAISEADKSLSMLVYSGLVRFTPDRKVENDLAEYVDISDNGLTYTAALRETATFHDGSPVTADDVIFTIQKITDPLIKSPRRGNWDGVTVEKVDERTISFHLKQPYAPFLENLSVGILPREIWKNVSDDEFSFSQWNTLPIGSGPFKVTTVERNSGGIPDYYRLTPFKDYLNGAPYIEDLVFKFYPSEESVVNAFLRGDIESMSGVSPERAEMLKEEDAHIARSPLPRVFAVFFNQNQAKVLLNKEVRQALDLSAPKEAIVEDVLNGYGTPIDGPFPPGLFPWSASRSSTLAYEERVELAKSILEEAGWSANPQTGVLEKKSNTGTLSLSFSISTGDAPELRAVANRLVTAWNQLGAQVEVLVFETGDLNQNVIRPRQFDALLFGEVVGRDADVYPFWHSSQRNDPGLNIALYTNGTADRLLERARSAADPDIREENYRAFDQEIRADLPAVFLYSPSFLYAIPEKVASVRLTGLSTPQDRFLSITDWYIETDKVWEIFVTEGQAADI